MSQASVLALTLSALLTFALHWGAPDSGWLNVALILWLVGLALSLREAMTRPLLALALTGFLSCWWNHCPPSSLVLQCFPLSGLALVTHSLLTSERVIYRVSLWATSGAATLAAHAIACFWAFRAIGGGHRVRPPVTPGQMWLVWPYYDTHYPRGAHLVGIFLNDNLFGIWAVAFFGLSVVLTAHAQTPTLKKLLSASAVLLIFAAVWTYSRSAGVAALGVIVYLAARWKPRVLAWLVLVPILYLCFATWLDKLRFEAPTDQKVYPSERIVQVEKAGATLASGSLVGIGPGNGGLVDTQWAKIPLELGWLGIAAYGWLAFAMLRPGPRGPLAIGLQASLVAFWLGGIGTDVFESPHLAGTFYALWGGLERLREVSSPEPSPSASPDTD